MTYLFPDDNLGPRRVFSIDLNNPEIGPSKLFDTNISTTTSNSKLSLQEQLRRERMRLFTQGK